MRLPEINFNREREWWDAKAAKEGRDSADERMNRALRWREIERHLEGSKTILDIGGSHGCLLDSLGEARIYRDTFGFFSGRIAVAERRAV